MDQPVLAILGVYIKCLEAHGEVVPDDGFAKFRTALDARPECVSHFVRMAVVQCQKDQVEFTRDALRTFAYVLPVHALYPEHSSCYTAMLERISDEHVRELGTHLARILEITASLDEAHCVFTGCVCVERFKNEMLVK